MTSGLLGYLKTVAEGAAESICALRKVKQVRPRAHKLMQAKALSLNGPDMVTEYQVLKYFVEAYSSDRPPPLLVFGDSVFLRVASDDQSQLSIEAILTDHFQDSVCLVSGSGYHSSVFEQFITVLAAMPARPCLAILPINLRSFSPIWDLNPIYQFRSEIGLLSSFDVNRPEYGLRDTDICSELDIRSVPLSLGCEEIVTLGDFLDIIGESPVIGSEEWKRRLKTIFLYHYTPPVLSTHRKVQSLKQTIKLLTELGVAVYSYITPINYEAGTEYCGESFVKAVEKNVLEIQREIKSTVSAPPTDGNALMFRLDNFTFQFARDIFFTRHNATEHLRFAGRNFIARRVTEAWESMLESGDC